MVELTLYTPEMSWEVLNFIPGEAEVKILRADPEGGARTMFGAARARRRNLAPQPSRRGTALCTGRRI